MSIITQILNIPIFLLIASYGKQTANNNKRSLLINDESSLDYEKRGGQAGHSGHSHHTVTHKSNVAIYHPFIYYHLSNNYRTSRVYNINWTVDDFDAMKYISTFGIPRNYTINIDAYYTNDTYIFAEILLIINTNYHAYVSKNQWQHCLNYMNLSIPSNKIFINNLTNNSYLQYSLDNIVKLNFSIPNNTYYTEILPKQLYNVISSECHPTSQTTIGVFLIIGILLAPTFLVIYFICNMCCCSRSDRSNHYYSMN